MLAGYRLSLGKVDGSGVEGIGAFTLKPNQPLKLVLHTRPPTTQELEKIAKPTKADPKAIPGKGPGLKAPGLEGRLELVASDGRTVLGTLTLHDVQVEPAGPAKAALPLIKGAAGTVELTAQRVELAFTPMMAR
jgi:hypothetical protein